MSDEKRPPYGRWLRIGPRYRAGRGDIALHRRAKNLKHDEQLIKYLRRIGSTGRSLYVCIISTSFMIAGQASWGLTNDCVNGYVAQHASAQILDKLPKGTNYHHI